MGIAEVGDKGMIADFHTGSEKTKSSIFGFKCDKVIKIGVNGRFYQKIYMVVWSSAQILRYWVLGDLEL